MRFTPDHALVQRVNACLRSRRQGDVLELEALTWVVMPGIALTAEAAASAGDGLTSVAAASAHPMAVISQTCDVVRDCEQRRFLLLAPVVTLEKSKAGLARRGSSPRYVHLPGLGDDAFVDLDRVVTIEKSVVLEAVWHRGLPEENSQRLFGERVARSFSRFAFPDDLIHAVQGLVERIKEKHVKDSNEGKALRTLKEIRITGVPSWHADEIDTFISFSPATREEALQLMEEQAWDELIDEWIGRTKQFGSIRRVDGMMIPLDEMAARDYLNSDPLDLEHLSSSN